MESKKKLHWWEIVIAGVFLVSCVVVGIGCVGLIDDALKYLHQNTRGLSGLWKCIGVTIVSVLGLSYLYVTAQAPAETQLSLGFIPFMKPIVLHLGVFYIIWGCVVILASSHAVNLTDGLDGLAVIPFVLTLVGLSVFAYMIGHPLLSAQASIPCIPGTQELCIFAGAMVGASLGFLWFNAHPAELFMGDVGALSLGAAMGLFAFIIRQEFMLLVMGGVFVMETLSVIIQVFSFRVFGRRVFAFSPIHHHFEINGWPETKIVVRFWIVSAMFVCIGLLAWQ